MKKKITSVIQAFSEVSYRAGEMTQKLRVLAALSGGQDLVPYSNMEAHKLTGTPV